MDRLKNRMYYERGEHLFGIQQNQIRSAEIVHNGGWHNRAGEELGFGDLHAEDLHRIAQILEGDELFIILPEEYRFMYKVESREQLVRPAEDEKQEHVAQKAWLVIAPCYIYKVVDFEPQQPIEMFGDFEFHLITRQKLREIIQG